MKSISLFFMLCSICLSGSGQAISITFTATGAASQIDSITATNLRTGNSVTLPGSETLVLSANSGIPATFEGLGSVIVYPNPFAGQATFSAHVQTPQAVCLRVQNLAGQVVAQSDQFVMPGDNNYTLSLNSPGIYMVSLISQQGTFSSRVICTGATEPENRVQYKGTAPGHNPEFEHSGYKSLHTGYTLGFATGDRVLYKVRSGLYTTVLTDSVPASKSLAVEMDTCVDADGKNYPIVKIGTQTWMAGNLAYLPSVGTSYDISDTLPYYFVYGSEGGTVEAAKANPNYAVYGVLYNWEAAKISCPVGWHLPTDNEWKMLEKYLGMSVSDAGLDGWRNSGSVGAKLKETGSSHWGDSNPYATNSSGFTALPGGGLTPMGGFVGVGYTLVFWTSSGVMPSDARARYVSSDNDGVSRYFTNRSRGQSVRCLRN